MGKKTDYDHHYYLLNRETPLNQVRNSNNLLNRLMPDKNQKTTTDDTNRELIKSLSDTLNRIRDSINWDQDLQNTDYAVFDTETTGFHPFRGDEIISIGAVMIENRKINEQKTFYQLVNPKRPISAPSRKITGITNQMLEEKPIFEPVLLDFLEYCGPRILVAHNAPFDLAFINIKLGSATKIHLFNPVIDTVLLASAIYPNFGDYSLENLAPRFGIDLSGRHNALSDARIAALLFLHLLEELQKKDITNLQQLAQLFSEQDRYKGYPLIF